MTLVDTNFPEDSDIVVSEVLLHLLELDARRFDEPADLALVWAEVHRCDDDVLEALDAGDRMSYQASIDRTRPEPSYRSRREPNLRERVAHLHLALHRRLVLLRDLVPDVG
jgi:hypothetical protein